MVYTSGGLTNGVPKHATCDSGDEPGILMTIIHGAPARLIIKVELQTATDSDGSAENKEDERVENCRDEGRNKNLAQSWS